MGNRLVVLCCAYNIRFFSTNSFKMILATLVSRAFVMRMTFVHHCGLRAINEMEAPAGVDKRLSVFKTVLSCQSSNEQGNHNSIS